MMNNKKDTPAASEAPVEPFQARVQPWMMACFGPAIAADGAERNHRFLEESLELVQSCGCTASEAHQLVDYVYGRPVGERAQEVGGVMVTLAALCLAQGLDMHAAGETELARIWTKVEAIRAKQAAKPKHSPLPTAAPQAPADGPTATSQPQPIIGRLMDQISALPVLWGLNEPGALLRNSDVLRVLAAAGREQASLANGPAQAQAPAKRKCNRFGHTCNCTKDCPKTGQVGGLALALALAQAQPQPVAVPDGCGCDDGLIWKDGCTSPCLKCQDVTDDSAAPVAHGDALSQQEIAEIINDHTDQGSQETDAYEAADAIRAAIVAKPAS